MARHHFPRSPLPLRLLRLSPNGNGFLLFHSLPSDTAVHLSLSSLSSFLFGTGSSTHVPLIISARRRSAHRLFGCLVFPFRCSHSVYTHASLSCLTIPHTHRHRSISSSQLHVIIIYSYDLHFHRCRYPPRLISSHFFFACFTIVLCCAVIHLFVHFVSVSVLHSIPFHVVACGRALLSVPPAFASSLFSLRIVLFALARFLILFLLFLLLSLSCSLPHPFSFFLFFTLFLSHSRFVFISLLLSLSLSLSLSRFLSLSICFSSHFPLPRPFVVAQLPTTTISLRPSPPFDYVPSA